MWPKHSHEWLLTPTWLALNQTTVIQFGAKSMWQRVFPFPPLWFCNANGTEKFSSLAAGKTQNPNQSVTGLTANSVVLWTCLGSRQLAITAAEQSTHGQQCCQLRVSLWSWASCDCLTHSVHSWSLSALKLTVLYFRESSLLGNFFVLSSRIQVLKVS